MNQLPAVVVKELDVSVLLRSDSDGKSRVTEDFVDLTGSTCQKKKTDVHREKSHSRRGNVKNLSVWM